MAENSAERNYKVFISYRHLPLDMEVAAKLQTTVERFTIPADYRKNDEKKLGIVFRDKNELQITNNLGANLRDALDHSEYLVVICSKETKESRWVLEEISYFLKHHDREHVMVFLVDGSMEESVPTQLMGITDQNGNIIEEIEPLAANIVSKSSYERKRLYRVEVLRILATLIGCPFDTLYHRNQRYTRQRMIFVSAFVMATAITFIVMLLNRNHIIANQYKEIANQYSESQIKESELSASLSKEAEKDGKHTKAIQYALQALPDNDDRPYVAEAELNLSNLMHLYSDQKFQYEFSLETENSCIDWCMSADGKYIATNSYSNKIRVYSGSSRKLLYSFEMNSDFIRDMYILNDNHTLIIWGDQKFIAKDMESGKSCWERTISSNDEDLIYSKKCDFFLIKNDDGYLRLYADKDNSLQKECLWSDESGSVIWNDFVLSPDQSLLCFFESNANGDGFYVWNLKQNKIYKIKAYDFNLNLTLCTITDDNRIIVSYEDEQKDVCVACFKLQKGKVNTLIEKSFSNLNSKSVQEDISEHEPSIQCNKDEISIVNRNALILLKAEDFSVMNTYVFSDSILDTKMLNDGQIAVVTEKGEINLFSKSGLSSEKHVNYFQTNFTLSAGQIQGTTLKDLIVMVQSQESSKQFTCIRWKENEGAIWENTVENKDEDMEYFSSPNEKYFCLIKEGWDSDEIFSGSFWKSGKLVNRIHITKKEWKKTGNSAFIGDISKSLFTNDGKLIVDQGSVLDLKNNTVQQLQKDDSVYTDTFSYIDPAHDNVVTTLRFTKGQNPVIDIFIDGVFQEEVEMGTTGSLDRIMGVNSDGNVYIQWADSSKYDNDTKYAVYIYDSETHKLDNILPYKENEYYETSCEAVAENHPYYAYVTTDGNLYIMDLSTGKKKCRLNEESITDPCNLIFSDNDKYLIFLSDKGTIDIFDVESGKILHHSIYNSRGKDWFNNMRCEVSLDKKHDRMAVIAIMGGSSESVCFVFKLSTMEMVGSFKGPVHFNQKKHAFVVNPLSKRLLLIPFYHTDDIIALAKKYLGE